MYTWKRGAAMNDIKKSICHQCINAISKFIIFSIIAGIMVIYAKEGRNHNIPFDEMKEYGQRGECAQENYILIQKANGIHTYPVLWGESLYLYDIDGNKFHLLKALKLPFQQFNRDELEIQSNIVKYNYDWADSLFTYVMHGGIYTIDLSKKGISKTQFIKDEKRYCILYNQKLYYMKYGREETNNAYIERVYSCDLDGKNEKFIAKGQSWSLLRAEENSLYLCDYEKNQIIEYQLPVKRLIQYQWKYKEDEEVVWLGKRNKDCLLILTGPVEFEYGKDAIGNIYEYNRETQKNTLLAQVKDMNNTDGEINVKYRDNYLYYNNMEYEVSRVNLVNGKKKKLLSLNDIDALRFPVSNGSIEVYFNYCTDYITAEVDYCSGGSEKMKKKILVYNYDGKLLRNLDID